MITLESLPRDLIDRVMLPLLLGLDLIQLSMVSRHWHAITTKNSVWQGRLSQETTMDHSLMSEGVLRKAYLKHHSLRFRGQYKNRLNSPVGDRCSAVDIGLSAPQLLGEHNPSFTIDLSFALLDDPDARRFTGGVLFGSQCIRAMNTEASRFFDAVYLFDTTIAGVARMIAKNMILIDEQRRLYCSVLNDDDTPVRPILTTALDRNRWYHVAIRFDGLAGVQDVFLDGQRVSTRIGRLFSQWRHLGYTQVGTGAIRISDTHNATLLPNGLAQLSAESVWYGFEGLIDEARVWCEALTDVEIQTLATHSVMIPSVIPYYSMKRHGRCNYRQQVETVRCSRPVERSCALERIRGRVLYGTGFNAGHLVGHPSTDDSGDLDGFKSPRGNKRTRSGSESETRWPLVD